MKAKDDNLFSRTPGTTNKPTQSTRIDGFTINGRRIPADKLPQTFYLDQVKAIGAAFFAEAMQVSAFTLVVGSGEPAPAVPLTPVQLERVLEVFANRGTDVPDDDVIQEILVKLCTSTST